MEDSFGRLFTFIFGTILLFMAPLTIIMVKQDDVKQTLIDDAVVEFVDNARASGEITPTSYSQFINRVNSVQNLCDISIVYESTMQAPKPVYDSTGTTIESFDGYTKMMKAYTKEDIANYMFYETNEHGEPIKNAITHDYIALAEPEIFPLKEGGYISVKVINTTPTPGTKMLRMFLPRYAGKTLVSSYSGYVGNTKQ